MAARRARKSSHPSREAEKRGPVVLVLAREAAARRSLTPHLTPEWSVRELELCALGESAPHIDAAGAVAILDAADGLDTLAQLKPLGPLPAGRSLVLVLRGASEGVIEAALQLLHPAQVLTDPVPAAVLRFALRRALPVERPGQGARDHQRRAPALLGVSAAIREVLEQVKRVAPSQMPVLILGETGTGKELVARAVHDQSPRRDRALVTVNCSALPETLLESELFGYCRGAFTGAERDKQGLFEIANGGTLFLDEVGDTSAALQSKLLRALENQEIRPVGGSEVRQIDVRLVSATNRDLEAAIEENKFRRDLYYRINAATIFVPPLRRRRVDIPFLAQHFAEEFGAEHAHRITLDEDFLETLSRCDFPGNVRELRNAVERAIALAAPEQSVSARHLQALGGDLRPPAEPRKGTLRERVEAVEIEALREALQLFDGNRTKAAEALGLSRLGLRKKLRRLGLERALED